MLVYFAAILLLSVAKVKADAGLFKSDDIWSNFGELADIVYKNCLQKTNYAFYTFKLKRCVSNETLPLVNSIFDREEIVISDGFTFIKDHNSSALLSNSTGRTSKDLNWKGVLRKAGNVLETHLLRIDLKSSVLDSLARRRRQNQMMALVMFGLIATKMVMIPMGFHFLTVLGGKALLLAKMALMLSSIQGLKRIATSDVNYGLYHQNHQNAWRSDAWRENTEGTNVVDSYQSHLYTNHDALPHNQPYKIPFS